MKILCRFKLTLFLLAVFYIAGLGRANAQSVSNAGTEFWSVFPTHIPSGNSLAANSIFITSSQASAGVVTVGSFTQRFSVTPNTVFEVQVPRPNAYINDFEGNKILTNRAIHVVVDAGQPKVEVYSHIFAGQRSAASLILPKEALSQKYFSMNFQENQGEGQNFIVIVATEANTRIHIKKNNVDLVAGGINLPNVNDVYEYLVDGDLTGTSVSVDTVTSGCKKFAVFSGNSTVQITAPGCNPGSEDPLFQQCYPIESWGVHYGFVPFSMVSPNFRAPVRTAGQYVRVLAAYDGTVVNINGAKVATLNAGQFYTTPIALTQASYITGSKPISVAQFALTQACANLAANTAVYSDPDMVILNPIEYNIKNITVFSSTRQAILEEYINVLIKTASAPSFRINNTAPQGSFVPMANLPGYSYLQLDLTKLNTGGVRSFNLSADDGFNAIAYGFGNVESYSYSAGTNLASNQTVSTIKTSSGLVIDSACVNDNFFFKLTLPFKSPQITWQMDPNETPTVQNNPTATVDTTNGITSYLYTFPKTPAYNNTGLHIYKILAQYPASLSGCSTGQQQIDGSFYVVPLPVASFTATPETCPNTIDFTDKTSSAVGTVKQWAWDFGDPTSSSNTSGLQNPIHTYSAIGTYYAKLTVTSSAGCQSSKTDTLQITQGLALDFSNTSPDCSGQVVTFTDQSTVTGFVVATRKWDFGDGTTVTANSVSIQNTYKKPGKYNVKLVLVSTTGCQSDTLTKQITVNPSPIANFNIPAVCITDTAAHFIDKSTMSDSSNVAFTYKWNFGDQNATPANNTSNLQSPSHHYTQQGPYTATLTVTTPTGCADSLKTSFFVNGATPKAGFNIGNNGPVCSGQPVIVNNTATVDFGVVTKIEYYFDAVNQPTTKVVIDTPKAGVPYLHTYPVFRRLPDTKIFTIKQLAYSGGLCIDSTTQQVTIVAIPLVQFTALRNVCLLDAPFQVTQGSETTGIAGSGTYSGSGISSGGVFTPLLAGTGGHLITYKFTSPNGCADSLTQNINVIANPTVNAGKTIYLLRGNSVVLKPTVTGSNLSYNWTPATGLNRTNILNPVATPLDNITYTITVSDDVCSNQDTVHILVLKPPIIPNTFTPNADAINDVWNIKYLSDYPNATIEIFNRYGKQLYYAVGYGKPWDGTYQGKPVPEGTYYYKIDPKSGQLRLR
jgi:gliding motility-associated-like protein